MCINGVLIDGYSAKFLAWTEETERRQSRCIGLGIDLGLEGFGAIKRVHDDGSDAGIRQEDITVRFLLVEIGLHHVGINTNININISISRMGTTIDIDTTSSIRIRIHVASLVLPIIQVAIGEIIVKGLVQISQSKDILELGTLIRTKPGADGKKVARGEKLRFVIGIGSLDHAVAIAIAIAIEVAVLHSMSSIRIQSGFEKLSIGSVRAHGRGRRPERRHTAPVGASTSTSTSTGNVIKWKTEKEHGITIVIVIG